MMVDEELISAMKKTIKTIVMNTENITNYLDLYNYPSDCYETMDEYILDKYNYELFGKSVFWKEFETIGLKEIHNFIPSIINISHRYSNYYDVISWIQNGEYYKLMSLYALSISYNIIKTNITTIKMTWFNNDASSLSFSK
jgi:hypothetical protein